MKYTLFSFLNQFKNEADCLDFLFALRSEKACLKCGGEDFYPVRGRKTYACKKGHQVSPTAGTIFHKSSTPLLAWFHAIYLMSVSKNGVSAKELQRHLGVTYKTAWRMGHQIRKSMAGLEWWGGGTVEADETYIGGRRRGRRGRGAFGKTPVFGFKLRETGFVQAWMVPNVKRDTLMPFLTEYVGKGSLLMTDEMNSYKNVKKLGYRHRTVEHGAHEYVRGKTHTNSIEGFWSQLKRSIDGTHHSVSRKHLQAYVDERVWIWNRRGNQGGIVELLLRRAARLRL